MPCSRPQLFTLKTLSFALSVVNQHEHQCVRVPSSTSAMSDRCGGGFRSRTVRLYSTFLILRGGRVCPWAPPGSFLHVFILRFFPSSQVVVVIKFVLMADELPCLPTSWKAFLTCSMVPERFFLMQIVFCLHFLVKTYFRMWWLSFIYMSNYFWSPKFCTRARISHSASLKG